MVLEVVKSVSTAISIASRLKGIAANIKDVEFKNLLADLSIELADVKMKLAGVLDENTQLKDRLRVLENAEGEPCPSCHKHGWHVVSSKPDPKFELVGAIKRQYKCSFCGYEDESTGRKW